MEGARSRTKRGVTQRNIEYIKAIYKLGGEPGGCLVRIGDLARELNVSASTISIMVRRLQYKGLVNVSDGHGVCLTQKGLQTLIEYIWKHAIMELVLVKAGLDEETAKEMAKKLAPSLTVQDAWRIVRSLGTPKTCPHGKLIPYPGSKLERGRSYCGLY